MSMPSPAAVRAPDAVTHTDNVRGAMWMLASAVVFSSGSVLIKIIGQNLPSAEIVFFRCLFGLTVVAPFVIRYGLAVFRTQRSDLHAIRVICAAAGMNGGFYATTHLDLATASALSYTRPLFMIVLAVVFLGEIVKWRRGVATVVGFLGVVIILGPRDIAFTAPALAGLFGAFAVAGATAVVKQQAAVDGPATIMVWFGVGTAIITAVPAMFVWIPPTSTQWIGLVALGIVSSMGQYLMIRALALGEVTVMNPIDYLQIIVAAASGYWLFGEVPTVWTVAGAAVIVVSTLYILFREAAIKKTPPPLVRE